MSLLSRRKSPSGASRSMADVFSREERRKLHLALAALCLVTLAGTIGFAELEDWSLWDAFYFTLITITTVGYSDAGLSEVGRKFATLLLIGGVGTMSYSFTLIVQNSVARQLAWRTRMQKRTNRLRHHTIVCGFGRMGASICERLHSLGVSFVVVERDPANFQRAVDSGFLAVQGHATEDSVLLEAGLSRATHVVATVDSVASNIVITMGSKEINPEIFVIARAESDKDLHKMRRAGADRIISPFKSGGAEIVTLITNPKVADFLASASLGTGNIALADVLVSEGSRLVGKTLAEYGRNEGNQISFVAFQRHDQPVQIPPQGSVVIMPGDELIVAGDTLQIEKMTELARPAFRSGQRSA